MIYYDVVPGLEGSYGSSEQERKSNPLLVSLCKRHLGFEVFIAQLFFAQYIAIMTLLPEVNFLAGRKTKFINSLMLVLFSTLIYEGLGSEKTCEGDTLDNFKGWWNVVAGNPAHHAQPSQFNSTLRPLDNGAQDANVWVDEGVDSTSKFLQYKTFRYTIDKTESDFCGVTTAKIAIKYYAESATAYIYPCKKVSSGSQPDPYCYLDTFNGIEWKFESEITLDPAISDEDEVKIEAVVLPGGYFVFDEVTIHHDGDCTSTTTTESTTVITTESETPVTEDTTGSTFEPTSEPSTEETTTTRPTPRPSTTTTGAEETDAPVPTTETDDPSSTTDTDEPSSTTDTDDPSSTTETDDPSSTTDTDDPSSTTDTDDPSSTTETDDPSPTTDTDDPTSTGGSTLNPTTPTRGTQPTGSTTIVPLPTSTPSSSNADSDGLSLKQILLYIVLPVVIGVAALVVTLFVCSYGGFRLAALGKGQPTSAAAAGGSGFQTNGGSAGVQTGLSNQQIHFQPQFRTVPTIGIENQASAFTPYQPPTYGTPDPSNQLYMHSPYSNVPNARSNVMLDIPHEYDDLDRESNRSSFNSRGSRHPILYTGEYEKELSQFLPRMKPKFS